MSALDAPFNIELLLPTTQTFHMVKPVKTLDTFEGGTKQFHPDGLFSTEIFGKVGDPKRNTRFSYIDFKIPVFHPIIYLTLVKLKRLYSEIITGKTYAVWDNSIKDFVKSNQLDGKTGFKFFEDHWQSIDLREGNSGLRNENIKLIKKYKNNPMCSLLVVSPAGLRDYEIKDNGMEEEEEINVLYRKMLSLSNSISVNTYKMSTEVYNQSRVNIQNTFCDIYELIINSIRGKKKLYMGKWATRAIHDSTRNVITTTNVVLDKLGDPNNPAFNSTIVGLFQAIKLIAPITRFRVKEFLSKNFHGPKMPVTVIDKETLESKQVNITPKEFDIWNTDEGLDKILNAFSVEELRQKDLIIADNYAALLYEDGVSFKVFHDIKELPEGFDRKYIRPLRVCDMFYLILYKDFKKYPNFSTRYPVTGYGSIYPTRPYLRSTLDSKKLKALDEQWTITQDEAPEFPGKGFWFNSMSPPMAFMSRAGADFDGDKMSLIALMASESLEELDKKFMDVSMYVGTDGKISFSIATDTVDFLMKNLISEVK